MPQNKSADKKKAVPGNHLKGDERDATYDKNGDLAIKSRKPIAAVEGGEVGTADTGVKAKIQEPVTGEPVNPIDTVDPDSMNEPAREAHQPQKVEDEDGNRTVDEAQAKVDEENKEKTLEAAGANDTEAAKEAEKSQAENKKAQDTEKTEDK